jgi:NADH dehydrogenase
MAPSCQELEPPGIPARFKTPAHFRFHNRGNLAVVGRNVAVVHWDSLKLKGFIAWLVWGVAHVYLLVGFHNRFLVSMRWLWTYLTFQRGGRLITEDVLWSQSADARQNGTRASDTGPTTKARTRADEST